MGKRRSGAIAGAALAALLLGMSTWTVVAPSASAGGIEVEPFALRNGDIVVADEGAGTVVIVRDPVAETASVTTVAAGLASPRGVAITDADEILVVERDAGVVRRLLPDGSTTVLAEGLERPDDVVARGEAAAVVDTSTGRVLIVSEGADPVEIEEMPAPVGIDLPSPSDPFAVSVGGTGEGDGAIALVDGDSPPSPYGGPYQLPRHLDIAGDDSIFLADEAGRVVESTGPGGPGRLVVEDDELVGAVGMAVDRTRPGGSSEFTLWTTVEDRLVGVDPVSGEFVLLTELVDGAGVDVHEQAEPPPTTGPPETTTTTQLGVAAPDTTTSTVPDGGDDGDSDDSDGVAALVVALLAVAACGLIVLLARMFGWWPFGRTR